MKIDFGETQLEKIRRLEKPQKFFGNKEWVGLTTDELVDLVIKHAGLPTKLAEAIKAKFKKKNAF